MRSPTHNEAHNKAHNRLNNLADFEGFDSPAQAADVVCSASQTAAGSAATATSASEAEGRIN